MSAFVDVTFRIPVNLGEGYDHRGMYKAAAAPINLPDDHKGYNLVVMKRDRDDRNHLSLVWSETLKLKEGGFVLSNHEVNAPALTDEDIVFPSNYLRISPSPFVLRLKVSVVSDEPEKLSIKLIGPFSGC